MSSTWIDDREAEAVDLFGDEGAEGYFEEVDGEAEGFAEAYDDESADDSESARSRRRARARARARRARARGRARARAARRARYGRAARAPGYLPRNTTAVGKGFERVGTEVRETQAAVSDLELENKVQADVFGSSLAAQGRRLRASETTAAVSAVISPLQSFLQTLLKSSAPNLGTNPFFKAGLPLAPLLLLKPENKGLLADPRAWAVAAVGGLAISENVISKRQAISGVNLTSVPEIAEGDKSTFFADVVDSRGLPVPGKVATWSTSDDTILKVNAATGEVEAVAAGTAIITASADGISRKVFVKASPVIRNVNISSFSDLAAGDKTTFIADVVDSAGLPVPGKTAAWSTSDDKVLKVNAATGEVEAVKAGTAVIAATVDGIARRVLVKVT